MSGSSRGKERRDLGYFGYITAVVLACLLVGFFAYLEGRQSERQKTSTREYAQVAKRNAEIACGNRERAAITDCVYDEIVSANEQSAIEQDLHAQQWMARWAGLLTVITVITTLISWFALQYLRDTFIETRKAVGETAKATKAMERQNELTEAYQRPWLKVEIISFGPVSRIKRNHFMFNYAFKITNTSSFPALIVSENIGTEKADSNGRIAFSTFIAEAYELLKLKTEAIAPNSSETFHGGKQVVISNIDERGLKANKSLPTFWLGVAYQRQASDTTYVTIKTFSFSGDKITNGDDTARFNVGPITFLKTLMR